MLDVIYEARELDGRLAVIREGRGLLQIHLEQTAPLEAVLVQLNEEFARLAAEGNWFQLWRDEIIGPETPGRPLKIWFRLEPGMPVPVYLRECRGLVDIRVNPDLSTTEFAAAMHDPVAELMDGGHWFQVYGGEIIDMCPAA